MRRDGLQRRLILADAAAKKGLKAAAAADDGLVGLQATGLVKLIQFLLEDHRRRVSHDKVIAGQVQTDRDRRFTERWDKSLR